ncbi:MAG: TonB-dependent receptor [Candidatus Acidiferrales bacterium]
MHRRICQGSVWLLASLLAMAAPSFARQTATPDQLAQTAQAPAGLPPQGPIDATGFVKTTDSSPVPGATLRLTNTDTRQIWVSWTDPTGKFEFPTLTPGHYTIEATQLGFAPASTEAQFSTPPPQPPALQLILRVATLAELTAPAESNQPERGRGQRPNGGAPGTGQNAANGPPGGRGGRGGRGGQGGQGGGRRGGQLPQGLLNAMQQGLAGGGFQQTDVTGASEGGDAGIPEANAPVTPTVGGSSDSFLLQGTVGQGLSYNAGGFPGGGFRGPDGPGGPGGPSGDAGEPGGAAGQMFGGGAGPGGGGPGGAGGGPGGGFGGGRGGRAIMIFNTGGGGGRGGPLGRLFRQQVNRIRYSFYDSYQNSAFDARPYAITGTPAPKVGHYDERVGGNMGGPLKIPHIYNGADHTYFFLNYQHETVSNAINTFSTVPTADQRNGCFPTGTIFQPFTTTPVTTQGSCAAGDDQVPIDPVAQKLLNFIPKPTPTTSGLNGTQNYLLQAATPENTDRVNGTILHTINAKFNVNGSYNFSSQREDTLSNFVGIGGHDSTRSQNLTLGLSHNWTPHVVETTSVNWSRNRVQLLSDNSYNAAFSPASLGIDLGPGTPLAVDYGIPQVSFTTYSGFNDPIPSLVRNQTFRVDDNISWAHAKHTMRFGGEVRRVDLNTQSNPNPRGGFVFTGIATGNEFADFLEGLPFNTTGQFGNPNTYFRGWGFDLYAQDDFRITKTFTAQFGLRYDAVTPPIELANNIVNLDITDLALVTTVQPGAAGVPRSLIHGQYHNFEPRIGIAWQPPIRPKTVVRAGYSIFYNTSIYDTLVRELAYQPPIDTAQTLTTSAGGPLTFEFPFQGGSSNLIAVPNTESVDPYYKPGYAQIWSLGTETSISQNWVLDLTYTGTKGTELDILRAPNRAPLGTPSDQIQANRIDKNATGFTFDQSGANSIYNALQARILHRFGKGFFLVGIYTYAKSLDDASSIGGAGGGGTVEQQDGNLHAEYGLSTFDIRNQFRLISMWQLPFGQRYRRANHGWEQKVFGDWRLQNIFTWQTGTPFTALLGGVASDNGTGANFSLRPNIVGDPNQGICGGSPSVFFNTGAFALPTDSSGNLTYGNEARGSVEGPCTFSWNAGLSKAFRFGPEQRHVMNIEWQVQNLTNTANYNAIGTLLPCGPGVSVSGIVCGAEAPGASFSPFGHVTSAGSMRTMSLTVRFNF